MELIFLGTGAGMPSKQRNVTAIALQLTAERGATWLFDCGEATQHKILHSPVKLSRIEKIFITHLHGDHIFGLPGLLGSRSFQGGDKPLTIYGPAGIKAFIDAALTVSGTYLTYPLAIEEIQEGIIFEDDQFQVSAKTLVHGVECYGFRILERDLPGPLLVGKLQKMGLPPGPLYTKIKNGETVTLSDGTQLFGPDFLGSPIPGKKIAILGDTKRCKAAYYLAKAADVLVHEASFAKEHAHLAEEYNHSTTIDAAKIAKGSNAKSLILTHISARYDNDQKLVEEAKTIFENTQIASDLQAFPIK